MDETVLLGHGSGGFDDEAYHRRGVLRGVCR